MSERIWARPVPTPGPGFIPANQRRAARAWTVMVTRRGRALRVVVTAPTAAHAAVAQQALTEALAAYVRDRNRTSP